MRLLLSLMILFLGAVGMLAQTCGLKGYVVHQDSAVAFANVWIKEAQKGTITDENGHFEFSGLPAGKFQIEVTYVGMEPYKETVFLEPGQSLEIKVVFEGQIALEEVVVTGTLKEVRKTDSPVPVEVFTPAFFRKNPTPNLFDALQIVNGVRPQINCNVCNTGDIHINGLEGPYTMVLIDGMPIVSSLGTVYGLFGIPNSMVERIEIVKGPASSLYGSEAVGGLINVITKHPLTAPRLSADIYYTSWQELNADLGFKTNLGKKADLLSGINYFHFGQPQDNNKDGFTDATLQHRISFFEKINIERPHNRLFSMAARYFYEDRWGGQTDWNKSFRGSDTHYGESIYTNRFEFIGAYQLPLQEKMLLSFSFNHHDQDAYYGNTPFMAQQSILFGQLTWDKQIGKHDLLLGGVGRFNYYDDNTPATGHETNQPDKTWLPGIFVQDEVKFGNRHTLLSGLRYDYHNIHGSIFTPRIAYKINLENAGLVRLNAGTGFRVINLFTEEHAALTGAREVLVKEALKPEKSYNINLNYNKKFFNRNGSFIGLDWSAWYTHFSNVIIPDYQTNANQIIYDNLDGHAVTKGMTLNLDVVLANGLKLLAGGSLMEVWTYENGQKVRPLLTESYSATWSISYKLAPIHLNVDYTGNLYGPMALPTLGPLDPRKANSPVWSIQNLQFTFDKWKSFEIYAGVKNLLNWTPDKHNPFLIARAFDPFDKQVVFDQNGEPQVTPDNPYGLTFDPTYVYAPNQGMRGFVGVRYNLK